MYYIYLGIKFSTLAQLNRSILLTNDLGRDAWHRDSFELVVQLVEYDQQL